MADDDVTPHDDQSGPEQPNEPPPPPPYQPDYDLIGYLEERGRRPGETKQT